MRLCEFQTHTVGEPDAIAKASGFAGQVGNCLAIAQFNGCHSANADAVELAFEFADVDCRDGFLHGFLLVFGLVVLAFHCRLPNSRRPVYQLSP